MLHPERSAALKCPEKVITAAEMFPSIDIHERECVSCLSSGHPAAQQCSEGWSQVGEACLRINSSRESYDNAQHYCKNLNGNIASLTTSKQVDFVLEELKKLQQQDKVEKTHQTCCFPPAWSKYLKLGDQVSQSYNLLEYVRQYLMTYALIVLGRRSVFCLIAPPSLLARGNCVFQPFLKLFAARQCRQTVRSAFVCVCLFFFFFLTDAISTRRQRRCGCCTWRIRLR